MRERHTIVVCVWYSKKYCDMKLPLKCASTVCAPKKPNAFYIFYLILYRFSIRCYKWQYKKPEYM